jgi:ABC-type lipoprotein export system ATPase subunit
MHSFSSRVDRPLRVMEMSAEDFVTTLQANHIDVFSVTDHNCFDPVYYSQLASSAKAHGMGLIYGSELNVYLPGEGRHHFQMGVYFSSEVNPVTLSQTLQDLYKLDSSGLPTQLPLLGTIIQKLFSLKCGFILIPECELLNHAYRTLQEDGDLSEIERHQVDGLQRVFGAYHAGDSFNETKVNNWAYSFFLLSKDYEDFSKTMSASDEKRLLLEVKAKIKNKDIKVSASAQRLYGIIVEYGKHYSFFHFSDWHNKEPYPLRPKNYVFGSIESPFDTLALAIADPYSRIVVKSPGEPKPIILSSFLKEMSFVVNHKEQSIFFTPGLNAIVGQRASGKSLLLAMIKKLSDKDDKGLGDYLSSLQIDPTSIMAKDYGDSILSLGNLADVAFVDQDAITEIYRHPKSLQSALKTYYPNPQKIFWSSFNEILSLSRSISLYNKNYRSVNAYLSFSELNESYNYSVKSKIDSSKLLGDFDDAVNRVQTLIDSLSSIGFQSSSAQAIKKDLLVLKSRYLYLAQAYNGLFTEIDDQIVQYKSELTVEQSTQNQVTTLYRESLSVISANFDEMLICKKLAYQLDSFAPILPDFSTRRYGNYLFASGFRIKEGAATLKDALLDKMFEGISRSKYKLPLTANLFFDFADGKIPLKADFQTPCDGLDEDFVNSSVEEENTLYEVTDENLVVPDFVSRSDLEKYEKAQRLDNISNSSLGKKSAAYLSIVIEEDKSILVFDQPEDNIDNIYISKTLVPLLKKKKMSHQLIFVTHNPSVAVYTDAFNYIYVTNEDDVFTYRNLLLEKPKDREEILSILDGGRPSFFNRNEKYGEILEEYLHGTKTRS